MKFRFPHEFESLIESQSEKSSTLGVFELREKSENDVFLVSRDFTNDDSENTLPAPLENITALPAPLEIDAVISNYYRDYYLMLDSEYRHHETILRKLDMM